MFFAVDEGLTADFAFKLTATASIIVDVVMWCTTERTYSICWDITGITLLSLDWFYDLIIVETIVFIPELTSPV